MLKNIRWLQNPSHYIVRAHQTYHTPLPPLVLTLTVDNIKSLSDIISIQRSLVHLPLESRKKCIPVHEYEPLLTNYNHKKSPAPIRQLPLLHFLSLLHSNNTNHISSQNQWEQVIHVPSKNQSHYAQLYAWSQCIIRCSHDPSCLLPKEMILKKREERVGK